MSELGRSGNQSLGRLLIVDDDAPLRRTMARQLERKGFEILEAATLREAYDVAAEHVPDYAVVDLNLADGHGMELVEGLRDIRSPIRVVVLTGYDSIASSIVATKAGAVGYLPKPADIEQLAALLLGEGHSEAGEQEDMSPMSADRIRWEHIQRVFEQCNRNVSETARRLNMHRRTLQRILSKRAPR